MKLPTHILSEEPLRSEIKIEDDMAAVLLYINTED